MAAAASSYIHIYDVWRDLVTFVQFKKREKHLSRSGCFSRFLNCANATKPRNASHLWVLNQTTKSISSAY